MKQTSNTPTKTNKSLDGEWADELEARLFYVGLPEKYWPGLVTFVQELLTSQRSAQQEQLSSDLLKWAGPRCDRNGAIAYSKLLKWLDSRPKGDSQ